MVAKIKGKLLNKTEREVEKDDKQFIKYYLHVYQKSSNEIVKIGVTKKLYINSKENEDIEIKSQIGAYHYKGNTGLYAKQIVSK